MTSPGFLAVAALASSLALFTAQAPQAQASPEATEAGRLGLLALPDALRERALAIQIRTTLPPASPGSSAWLDRTVKYTVPGRPVSLKVVGENVIIIVNVTAFERDASRLFILTQGQIWIRNSTGGLAYRTSIETVEVAYGEILRFYPLGLGSEGSAPLAIEIAVKRAADLSPQEAEGGAWEEAGSAAVQSDKAKR